MLVAHKYIGTRAWPQKLSPIPSFLPFEPAACSLLRVARLSEIPANGLEKYKAGQKAVLQNSAKLAKLHNIACFLGMIFCCP